MLHALTLLLAVTASPAPEAHAHWPIVAADAKVSDLVDRGVAMLYAFDVGEARVAFTEASQRAPQLAMPYIGEALAETIDINQPSTPDGERRGAAAVAKARAHLAGATETERMLVDALGKRYGAGTRRERFARYADVLGAYTKAHRDDPNVLALAAYAIYETQGALSDDKDGLSARGREALADLDRALVLDPQHLGAHHLRIHLLEDARRAHEAIPDADALASYRYPPGMSHLPHMASHVWTREGDYDRLVADNQIALENDRAWFALGNGPGQQYMRNYHQHDVEFVLYGLTTEGRNDEARALAQQESAYARVLVALRLHDDARILALPHEGGFWNVYARALAAAHRGAVKDALAERTQLLAFTASDEDEVRTATALVDAALARHAGNLRAAIAAYRKVYDATKHDIGGDPKDFWATPIGEGYGALLLAAGEAPAAEAVFTAELARFPNDPRLEWGLAEAQKAQGKDDGAARSAARAHWKGSAPLTAADLG